MIRMAHTNDGRTVPLIECEVCKTVIENANTGMALWRSSDGEFTEGGRLHFAHERCADKLENKNDDWMTDELSTFLRRLAHNCKADMTPKEFDGGQET